MSRTLYDNYKEIAKKHKGICKLRKTALGIGGMNTWRIFDINIPYRKGEINFLISEASPTKISYSFNIDLHLEFLIYREDWMDKIGKIFGLKEYEIGIKEFDEKFIIQGSNKRFILSIFDKQIREFILTNSSFSNLKLEQKVNKSELVLNAPFNESNFNKLEKTIEIMKRISDNIYNYHKNNNR